MNKLTTGVLLLSLLGLLSGCPGGGMETQQQSTATTIASSASSSSPAIATQANAVTSDLWTQGTGGIYYNSGNVGIGNTSPGATLDVAAPTSVAPGSNQMLRLDVGTTGIFGIRRDSSTNSDSVAFDVLNYSNTWQTAIAIARNGGNVGIGTLIPGAALDVSAPTSAGPGSTQFLRFSAGTTGLFGFRRDNKTDTIAFDVYNYANTWQTAIAIARNGGNIGIGTMTPGYPLDVSGAARVSSLLYNSDSRLKEQVEEVPDSLQKLLTLKAVTYHWNELAQQRGNHDKSLQLGVIAQDVEKVFPEAVQTNSDGYKSVNYPVLVAPLIGAVKQLQTENEKLKAQNDAFEKRLQKLEAHLLTK